MKNVTFLIAVMNGGGAERVISVLSSALVERGYAVTVFITRQSLEIAKTNGFHPKVKIISLEDEITRKYKVTKWLKMLKARLVTKLFRKLGKEKFLIERYKIRYYEKVKYLKKYFSNNTNSVVIAFLYDAIYLALLSVYKNNRVIISERGDPQQCLESKTNLAFFNTMFKNADMMVFQSPDVMRWYIENINIMGRVIFNPVMTDLPKRFIGIRKKRIVNFCRISEEKNLCLLINSFSLFVKEYPDYDLCIFGDPVGGDGEDYFESVKECIQSLSCKNKIHIFKAQEEIHHIIVDYAMFVSSSDYEGMSNSMLEAMAIGLPTICTNCPAGGARAVIKDHENGILVPVNDVYALANAMKEVAGNSELADKLSVNGTKIREILSVDRIVNQWMEIIND